MDDNPQGRELLRRKLVDGIAASLAVIGMRRSGKTSLMWQELAGRHGQGIDRSGLPLVSFEDERLDGLSVSALDEIQLVPGWDRFIRTVMGGAS
jgi:predicted AAA+ superfamily ATPase